MIANFKLRQDGKEKEQRRTRNVILAKYANEPNITVVKYSRNFVHKLRP